MRRDAGMNARACYHTNMHRGIDSLIEGVTHLGFRQPKERPEKYPSAPRGRKSQEDSRRGMKDCAQSIEAMIVDNPFDFRLPACPDLTKAGIAGLAARIEGEGTDALAWYEPFHFNGDNHWGIYIRLTGIEYIVQRVLLRQSRLGEPKIDSCRVTPHIDLLRQIAFAFLFYHERFHFDTEAASSILEIANGGNSPPYYARYCSNVYAKPAYPDEPLEEALANARAFCPKQETKQETASFSG